MTVKQIQKILKDTAYQRISGYESELKAAEYLKAYCEQLGVAAHLESFAVDMADMEEAHLYADGKEIPCEGYLSCGSGEIEAPLYYMPNHDPMSLAGAAGKVVLLDQGGMGQDLYKDLLEAGAVGFITRSGNVNYRDRDIMRGELRSYVCHGNKMLAVGINVKDEVKMVKNGVKTVKLVVRQKEYDGQSHNVVAEIPGTTDEWIVLTAHFDSKFSSVGSYDNMTGCINLLEIMEELKKKAPHRYGVRFIFCGSEERGLLGSKAYVQSHKEELGSIALNVNIDMTGTILGKFIARVSAEEKMVGYIQYMASEMGWGMEARTGVYSSDSTPFAAEGVPTLSFARLAGDSVAPIHNRYDTPEVLSPMQIHKDSMFICEFVRRMADAVKCPVSRNIPDNVKKELDEYLHGKRK